MPDITSISGVSSSQSYWINGERTTESQPVQSGSSSTSKTSGPNALSKEEQQQVRELKARDTEVRAHEAAHMAAGGQYVNGGAKYTYEKGPDGQRYAVGGEVSIDTSAVKNDPQATIVKMQAVKRAATAPANPSGQDRAVAASAANTEMNARKELAAQKSAGAAPGKGSAPVTGGYSSNGTAKPKSDPVASVINLMA